MQLGSIPEVASLRYTERYSESYLDSLRGRGDPLADRVVAELAASGELRNFHDLLGEVRRRAAEGSASCQELLRVSREVPAWADFAAMETGQRIIAAFPIHMGISLFAGSLCGGAVFQKMTIVTAMTGMLRGASNRRLSETSKMVVGMAFPGALEPGGRGHELLVRVRLLHAALRRFLVDSGRFRHATEVPINQQDLAITLALFGYLNMRSLARMGIRFRAEELASYNLLWRYAGYVLGIDDELLPRSLDEQREFYYASLKHQGHPDKIPPQTKDVLDAVARDATRRAPLLFGVVRKFLHQSCRWLSGNQYVSGMQLDDAGDDYWGIRALRGAGIASSLTWRRAPGGAGLLASSGTSTYRAWLRRARRDRDAHGEYRVRVA
jgi:hypothetical protein